MAIAVSCGNKTATPTAPTTPATPVTAADSVDDQQNGQSDLSDEVVHTGVTYYEFDKQNLTACFDSLAKHHPVPTYHDADTLWQQMRQCVAAIDRYRMGKARYYPDRQVKELIRSLGQEAAMVDNHGPGVDLTIDEWFLLCAAYYAPDISCLVNISQTPDHRAGLLHFGQGYSTQPWWHYLITKRQKGFDVRCLGDGVEYKSIRQLADAKGRKYYLLSDNSPQFFKQQLYWVRREQDVVKTAEHYGLPATDETIEYNTCYFDKDRLVWLRAISGSDPAKAVTVSDKPLLRLVLDGEKSQFNN